MIKQFIFILLLPISILAQNECIPTRPNKLVNDYTNTLTTTQANALEQKLRAYNDSTSTQITVAIMDNTCGDEIKFFATQVAQKWGVGQADVDNGCIILLDVKERNIAIQNGYGLEAYLTDAMTKRVIETVIIPQFKQGDYYRGLDQGTDAIFKVLAGQFEGDGSSSNNGQPPIPIFAIVIIVFIILSIIRNRRGGGGRGGYRGGGYWIGGFGTGGYSGGGFSGGGGFGGFGGGGFGGGGASGSW